MDLLSDHTRQHSNTGLNYFVNVAILQGLLSVLVGVDATKGQSEVLLQKVGQVLVLALQGQLVLLEYMKPL